MSVVCISLCISASQRKFEALCEYECVCEKVFDGRFLESLYKYECVCTKMLYGRFTKKARTSVSMSVFA